MKTLLSAIALPLAVASVLVQAGCGPTTTGNPQVEITTSSYVARNWMEWLIPSAFASVSQVKFCFKRVRFKGASEPTASDPSTDHGNIDFSIGEVAFSGGGGLLGRVAVPSGTYGRIEFDLDDHCPSGLSVQLANSNAPGNFSTSDSIHIRFDGEFVLTSGIETVVLDLQNIISQLDGVTGDSQIKNAAEAASGRFSDD